MTAKEKAAELVDKFDEYADSRISDSGRSFTTKICAKACALIAVDEILDAIDWHAYDTPNEQYQYWDEVKKEIEAL